MGIRVGCRLRPPPPELWLDGIDWLRSRCFALLSVFDWSRSFGFNCSSVALAHRWFLRTRYTKTGNTIYGWMIEQEIRRPKNNNSRPELVWGGNRTTALGKDWRSVLSPHRRHPYKCVISSRQCMCSSVFASCSVVVRGLFVAFSTLFSRTGNVVSTKNAYCLFLLLLL